MLLQCNSTLLHCSNWYQLNIVFSNSIFRIFRIFFQCRIQINGMKMTSFLIHQLQNKPHFPTFFCVHGPQEINQKWKFEIGTRNTKLDIEIPNWNSKSKSKLEIDFEFWFGFRVSSHDIEFWFRLSIFRIEFLSRNSESKLEVWIHQNTVSIFLEVYIEKTTIWK